ncbi:MAG: hypothetical protein DRJ42_04050 [Deltaproteobacteria bacterium]|nr:MAG: hypothetical protein DRJ42_04050 [Deltaproteobacteria bacterium]
MLKRRSSALAALTIGAALLVTLISPTVASAGGFELPGEGGARGLGRGGAFYARADDPMALTMNPANLADLSGFQIYLTGGINAFNGCFQRTSSPTNTYADTDNPLGFSPSIFDSDPSTPPFAQGFIGEGYPAACNESPVGPALGLVASYRIMPELGIGFGIVAPNGVGSSSWVPDSERYTTPGGSEGILPPPSRYTLLDQDQLFLLPSVGVAYRPTPWFRFGATFQWGIGVFDFTSMTVANPSQDPATDILTKLNATDAFIPALIVSAHFVPMDNLDVMAGFRWSDNVNASGTTDLTTGWYGVGDADAGIAGTTPFVNPTIDDVQVTAGQPWEVRLGLRYAQRITPRPQDPEAIERLSGRTEDAMANEWFDIEFDAIYLINKEVTDLSIRLPAGSTTEFHEVGVGGTMPPPSTLPIPENIDLPHQWNDQWLLRLGGDFNAIPGLATLRLGFSFETSAYESGGVFSNRDPRQYTGLDFLPGARFGVHGGLTVRMGKFDISLAYAHIFQSTITVSNEEAALRQVSAVTPDMAEITNAGSYSADYNLFHAGVNLRL